MDKKGKVLCSWLTYVNMIELETRLEVIFRFDLSAKRVSEIILSKLTAHLYFGLERGQQQQQQQHQVTSNYLPPKSIDG